MLNPEQARQEAIRMERNAILDGHISLREAKRHYPRGYAMLTEDELDKLICYHADKRHKRWQACKEYRRHRKFIKSQEAQERGIRNET